MKDYYKILEVDPKATIEQIKSQYRLLIHAWHPDKFPNCEFKDKAEEKIKEINEAFSVIGDTVKRENYDRALHSYASPPPPSKQQTYSSPSAQTWQTQSSAQPQKRCESCGLGDVFEQYGYSLSATAVEDPTTPSKFYGMFHKSKEGCKLVAIEIVVGNVSSKTLSVNPLYATLVDSNRFVYQPELAGRDEQLATVYLNAGEKAKGWVAFEIPEDATPASIKYVVEMFSNRFLQVGLTE